MHTFNDIQVYSRLWSHCSKASDAKFEDIFNEATLSFARKRKGARTARSKKALTSRGSFLPYPPPPPETPPACMALFFGWLSSLTGGELLMAYSSIQNSRELTTEQAARLLLRLAEV